MMEDRPNPILPVPEIKGNQWLEIRDFKIIEKKVIHDKYEGP